MTARRSLSFLFATAHLGGNVSPVMPIMRQLAGTGHKVRLMSDSVNRPDAQAAGAQFRPWRRAPNRTDRGREGDPRHLWAGNGACRVRGRAGRISD